MLNQVTYFELAGPDAAKLAAFYGSVFGWKTEPGAFPNYFKAANVGTEGGCGFRQEKDPERVLYIRVADLQATLDVVVKAGGKVLIPPTNVPGVVHFALFEDPAGNRTGIVQ
jgi:predicted enzyme related to lactoylglutathione lyase